MPTDTHAALNKLNTLTIKAQMLGKVPIEQLTTDLSEAAAIGFLAATFHTSRQLAAQMDRPPDPVDAFIQAFVRK